jgi:hypothetical protein
MRDWYKEGLPSARLSIPSAIFTKYSELWLIDDRAANVPIACEPKY